MYFEHCSGHYLGHQSVGCGAAVLDMDQEIVGGPLLAVQVSQLTEDEVAASVRIHVIV